MPATIRAYVVVVHVALPVCLSRLTPGLLRPSTAHAPSLPRCPGHHCLQVRPRGRGEGRSRAPDRTSEPRAHGMLALAPRSSPISMADDLDLGSSRRTRTRRSTFGSATRPPAMPCTTRPCSTGHSRKCRTASPTGLRSAIISRSRRSSTTSEHDAMCCWVLTRCLRAAIKTIMILAMMKTPTDPAFPQTRLWLLPRELLFEIFTWWARSNSAWLRLR